MRTRQCGCISCHLGYSSRHFLRLVQGKVLLQFWMFSHYPSSVMVSKMLVCYIVLGSLVENGRGERVRTSDLSVPNAARYQAALRPDTAYYKRL